MADNPSIDPGTSRTLPIEGDDIGGGVIRQGVVLSFGAQDASGRVTTSNPLPTADATGNSALGAPADAAYTSGSGSLVSLLKGIYTKLAGTLAVSGTVTTTPSGTQAVSAASLPLPTGAAADSSVQSVLTGVGAPADAAATTTGSVIAQLRRIANQLAGTIGISGTVTANAGTGSLTVNAPVGTPAFTRLSDGSAALTTSGGRLAVDGSGVTQPISASALPLPAGAATQTTLAAVLSALGAALAVTSTPVAGTPAITRIASSTSTTSGLVSNGSRKGVVIVNDGTANLFVKLGATASLTSWTYKLAAGQTLELPVAGAINYTGAIDLIWDVANGSAQITELA